MSAVATRTILACRETLAAGFGFRLAGTTPTAADRLDELAMPAGVTMTVREGHVRIVERLDPVALDELHAEAMRRAWRDGAWDIRLLRFPPLNRAQLMMIGCREFADPLLREELYDAALHGSLVTWEWLPMRDGPALRRKAHASRDETLDPDGGRSGATPQIGKPIRWEGLGGCDHMIQLGRRPATRQSARRPRRPAGHCPEPRATARQYAYLAVLHRRLGRDASTVPARLTRQQASAMIDHLLTTQP